jgi:hypothetical protein
MGRGEVEGLEAVQSGSIDLGVELVYVRIYKYSYL